MGARPTVDQEFADLCPALTAEELNLLEMSIVEEGCRESLVVWKQEGLLLDGHNRLELCERAGCGYKTRELSLPSREAAIEWIIANQLGRRNLSDAQKEYLRGKRYQAEKKKSGGTGANQHKQRDQNEPAARTAEKLAKEYHVSPATIKRDAEFATAIDSLAKNVGKEVKAEILSGHSPLTKKAVVEIASQEPKKQAAAVKAAKASSKSSSNGSVVKSDAEKLVERIEQLVEFVNRMAAHQMGHNNHSRLVVEHLRGTIPLVKSMQKSWRNQ